MTAGRRPTRGARADARQPNRGRTHEQPDQIRWTAANGYTTQEIGVDQVADLSFLRPY